MNVVIDALSPTVRLESVDDLDRFQVLAPTSSDTAQLEQALTQSGAGALSDDKSGHCWIAVSFLRSESDRASDQAWNRRFDAMLAYARSKNWLDAAGDRVLAHIEPLSVEP